MIGKVNNAPRALLSSPRCLLGTRKVLIQPEFSCTPEDVTQGQMDSPVCVCVGGGVPHDCFISNFSNSIMRALLVFQSQSKEAAILSLEPYLLNLHYFYSN